MKTQLQKPSAGKARYTPEYKQQALEHWRSSGRTAARRSGARDSRPAAVSFGAAASARGAGTWSLRWGCRRRAASAGGDPPTERALGSRHSDQGVMLYQIKGSCFTVYLDGQRKDKQ
jgi:hypothetical protein